MELRPGSKLLKYLPGFRLAWEVPGFGFLNTDLMLYIDDNRGVAAGGAPKEDDGYKIDVNWAYPLEIGGHSFSIEGHFWYIGERRNELGHEVWLLVGFESVGTSSETERAWQIPPNYMIIWVF